MVFRMVLLLLAQVGLSHAYQNGAPKKVCENYEPVHGVQAQTSQNPYSFTPSASTVEAGGTITVTIGGPVFAGFYVTGTKENSPQERLGSFVIPADANYKAGACTGFNGVTHTSPDSKESLEITWTAPSDFSGTICFKGAVAEAKATYWGPMDGTECVTVSEVVVPTESDETTAGTTATPDSSTEAQGAETTTESKGDYVAVSCLLVLIASIFSMLV